MAKKLAFVGALAAVLAAAGPAAAEQRCLTKAEQKAAISSGQAITLAAAIKAARGVAPRVPVTQTRNSREVVRARLCKGPEGLVYVLTVLARDGKVTRTTVDARSGRVVEAR
jgi:uncharacterized membrane protein YkoI